MLTDDQIRRAAEDLYAEMFGGSMFTLPGHKAAALGMFSTQLAASENATFAWPEDKEQAARIPPEHIDPASSGSSVVGWRFGSLTADGAVASPWRGGGWPAEGLRALCTPDGNRIYEDHTSLTPHPLCMCGMYACEQLGELTRIARLTPDDAEVFEDMDTRTQVIYQADVWGRSGDGNSEYAEQRWSYARVKPGGRAYVRPEVAHLADKLAARYGITVTVGTARGVDFLAEVERAEGLPQGIPCLGGRHFGPYGAAGLLLVRRGRVLLHQRPQGVWSIPGGARNGDETLVDAARREAAEELDGIELDRITEHDRYEWECECGWAYTTVAAGYDGADHDHIAPASEETLDVAWVPVGQVEQMRLHPDFRDAWPALQAMVEHG